MQRFLLILIFALAQMTAHPQSTTDPAFEARLDALVQKYLDLDIFSGVVLVAEKGRPVYHKAFGLADREKNIPNTVHTLFDIGSMNKTFTRIVVQQLAAEGKLRLDDKLVDYVKGFQDDRVARITIEQLLNHESGFGDYHDPDYFNAPPQTRTLWGIVDRAKKMELLFEPGQGNEYSNLGYVLLGAAIEKASGQSYFETVRERIVQPLGLKHTHLENLDQWRDKRATGYLKTPFGELESNDQFMDMANPDGGFLSTTMDVLTFYRSYFNDDLLLSEAAKATDPFFGMIRSLPPGKAPLIAGGFEGFNTAIFQVVSDDRSIIVFSNMDEPVAELLATGILDLTRGNKPKQPQLPAAQSVVKAFEAHGIDYVQKNFAALTVNFHPSDPKDYILNDLGYAYLFRHQDVDKALELFTLNTVLFPKIANTWDSLAEAWLQKGDKAKAKKYYKKALSIRPDLPSARKALKELN